MQVSKDYEDLLTGANTAVFTTLAPDGAPHSSPVWFLYDGGSVLVSTTDDRQKYRNLTGDPRVSLTVIDPTNPFRYVELRGSVTLAPDTDLSVRDAIARKHGMDDPGALDPAGTQRVTATINASRVIEH